MSSIFNKAVKFAIPAAAMAPMLAFAQGTSNPSLDPVSSLVTDLGGIVSKLIPVVIAIALLVFIWGLVKFIASSGDEGAKEKGKQLMIWGGIALFVIVAIFGIIDWVASLLDIQTGGTLDNPPGVKLN